MATDPWLSRQQAHDEAWVQLDAQLTAVVEAAISDVLARLWRLVLDERGPTVTAAVSPNTDGLEQAARETWQQALTRWVKPIAFAAYSRQRAAQGDPHGSRAVWWADTLDRVTETAERLVQAVRDTISGAPTESIDQLRDRTARVLGLDAATQSIRDRIDQVERRLLNLSISRQARESLFARRTSLQSDLFQIQAARARSKAYLALAQAMPDEAEQFRSLARQAARSAGDEARVRGELNAVDAQLYAGAGDSQAEIMALRAQRGSLYQEAHESAETWRNTAQRIARTESTNVLNEATLQRGIDQEVEQGLDLIKTWLSARDDRTRPTHRAAHGQVVGLHEPFEVGDDLMQRPGDPNGSPEEVIQCRCSIAVLTRQEHEEIAAVLAAGAMEETVSVTAVAPEVETELPIGWRGILAPLETRTGDGRFLRIPESGIRFREPPLPIAYQPQLSHGHDGAVIVSRIAKWWVQDGMLWGQGPYDLGKPEGIEAARELHVGNSNGISIDMDDETVTWDEETETAYFDEWRVMGATQVAHPAFNEARISPVYASDLDLTLVASLLAAGAEPQQGTVSTVQVMRRSDFDAPAFMMPTPLTVTQEGRVFGHLARWGVCHVGIGNACVTAPHSITDYAHFHMGSVLLDDGETLPIGKITLGGGHADPRLGFVAASEHYDNASAVVAYVRATEDEFGIAVAGRLLPGVDDAKVMQLRASPLSGDWRRVGGNLELVAALGVNVPGFPVPHAVAASAGGQQISLVAAGVVPPHTLEEAVRAEVRGFMNREARARQLAARLGLDPKSRAAALAARIDPNMEA